MLKYLILILMTFLFANCKNLKNKNLAHTQKEVLQDTTKELIMLAYGEPRPISHHIVAKKYGFHYKYVASCISAVTDSLITAVELENQETKNKLAQKYGAEWQNKFNEEIKTIEKHKIFRLVSSYR